MLDETERIATLERMTLGESTAAGRLIFVLMPQGARQTPIIGMVPMIVTVCLSKGTVAMGRKRVRHRRVGFLAREVRGNRERGSDVF